MLTKNWFQVLEAMTTQQVTNFSNSLAGGNSFFQIIGKGTAEFYFITRMLRKGDGNNTNRNESSGVVFSASDKVGFEDFKIMESVNSSIDVVIPKTITVSNGTTYKDFTVTYGVTANSPCVIKSVYLVGYMARSGEYCSLIIDHTLLETPITLQPGESKQITYTIRFNYPKAGA